MPIIPKQFLADSIKRVELGIKEVFFTLLRIFLKKGQPGLIPLDGNKVKSVLLLRPESKLGDMVVSLPVVDALKRRYPHIKISILCSPRNVGLIKDDPRFEKISLYQKNLFSDLAEVRRIRRKRFDCIIDLVCHDSVTSLVLSQYCAPGKPRVGVGKLRFAKYFHFNRYSPVGEGKHIVNSTLQLMEAFGVDAGDESGFAEIYLSQSDRDRARQFIATVNGNQPAGPLVGINVSAGAVTRRWAEQKQVALIKKIIAHDSSVRFIVICTPTERDQGRRLCEQIPTRLHLVPDRMSITAAAAVIKQFDLLITPDTSLVHIARSFQVPVVSLHSAARLNFVRWRPYGQDGGCVIAKHTNNIFDITVEQVFDVYLRLMASQKKVEN